MLQTRGKVAQGSRGDNMAGSKRDELRKGQESLDFAGERASFEDAYSLVCPHVGLGFLFCL